MNDSLSRWTLWIVFAIQVVAFHAYGTWEGMIIGGGDTWGYYAYLPSWFIYDDLPYPEAHVEAYHSYERAPKAYHNPLEVAILQYLPEHHAYVNKYTMGVSLLLTPFFLLAHALALMLGLPADGYSEIYRYVSVVAILFYYLLGIWALRKVLRRFVSDKVVAAVLIIISLATNLHFFVVYLNPMSHGFLFSLYAGLLYATIRWYEKFDWRWAVSVGALCGLITLIRPSEIICVLIPITWGWVSGNAIGNWFRGVRQHWWKYGLAGVAFGLMGIPQMIYWKAVTKQWIFYSYGNESFDFANPHLIDGLFSYQNGWLAYTPVMALAMMGIVFLFRQREALWPVLLFIPLHIYIIYSWWCWNYINGFGSRPMVETYALLAIPLAFLIENAWKKSFWRYAVLGFAGLCLWVNVFQTFQYRRSILFSEAANRAYVWGMMGKSRATYRDLVTFDVAAYQPDPQSLKQVSILHQEGFEDTAKALNWRQDSIVHRGQFGAYSSNAWEFGPTYETKLGQSGIEPGDYIRASIWAYRPYSGKDIYRMSRLVGQLSREGQPPYLWQGLRLDNKPGNVEYTLWDGKRKVWGEAYYFIQIPADALPEDKLSVYLWHSNAPPLLVDDFEVTAWKSQP